VAIDRPALAVLGVFVDTAFTDNAHRPEPTMNAATQTFLIAIASVAAAAAIGVTLADRTAAPAQEVVKLERVVVLGKRADTQVVAQLPRVVIEGRRAAADVTVAQAQPAARAL
jgi:hypothetical protein